MFWKTIKKHLSMMSTGKLVLLPILLSLLPISALFIISPGQYSGRPMQDLLVYLMFFLWGLSGIPIILRQEAPGIISFYGWLGVGQGLLMMLGSGALIIILIILKTKSGQ